MEVLPLSRRLVHMMARVCLVGGHVAERRPGPGQIDIQLHRALIIARILADAGDRSSARPDEPNALGLREFEEPSRIAPSESEVSLHGRQDGVARHPMLLFPVLDRRSESVLPPDVQESSDLPAQGIQLLLARGPRRKIVEVPDLSGQWGSRTANLADQGAEGGKMILQPVPSKAAWFLACETPQALERVSDLCPRCEGRQPDRIEVPRSEPSAVASP